MRRLFLAGVAVVGLLGVLYASGVGQTLFSEWTGHMIFRPTSPQVRFDGTLTFEKMDGTDLFTIGQSSAGRYVKTYTQVLAPTAIAAGVSGSEAAAEQSFTVTGLTNGDAVFISGPVPTLACPPTAVRASSPDLLVVAFVKTTTAVCTPASGTYRIVAVAS